MGLQSTLQSDIIRFRVCTLIARRAKKSSEIIERSDPAGQKRLEQYLKSCRVWISRILRDTVSILSVSPGSGQLMKLPSEGSHTREFTNKISINTNPRQLHGSCEGVSRIRLNSEGNRNSNFKFWLKKKDGLTHLRNRDLSDPFLSRNRTRANCTIKRKLRDTLGFN